MRSRRGAPTVACVRSPVVAVAFVAFVAAGCGDDEAFVVVPGACQPLPVDVEATHFVPPSPDAPRVLSAFSRGSEQRQTLVVRLAQDAAVSAVGLRARMNIVVPGEETPRFGEATLLSIDGQLLFHQELRFDDGDDDCHIEDAWVQLSDDNNHATAPFCVATINTSDCDGGV